MSSKTPTSIDVLVNIQHSKLGIDHDDSFETYGEAARFLHGIADALAAKASSDAVSEHTQHAEYVQHGEQRAMLTPRVAAAPESGLAERLDAGLVDGGGEPGVETHEPETPKPETPLDAKPVEPLEPTVAPICDTCKLPKVRGKDRWYCPPCRKVSSGGPKHASKLAAILPPVTLAAAQSRQTIEPAPGASRQAIEAPAVSSIDTAVTAGSRPMLLMEPPVTFPWSDKMFRAALSVLNTPAATRAKRIVITRRDRTFKAMTSANVRTGDEPVASFHLTSGRWFGMAETNPAAEYLIPEEWYVSKN